MRALVGVISVGLILLVLVDAFETTVLPRRVNRRFRLARVFYRSTWRPWSAVGRRMRPGRRRETYISLFGPLSMLFLLSMWALLLVTGFALLHWALRSPLQTSGGETGLLTYLYFSGTTFFTLGLGDITPREPLGRFLVVAESGIGFGFLAVVIGYLPVLYQAFQRREQAIALLDARAGSPPTAGQLLLRLAQARNVAALDRFLEDWERWFAELMESHLSFPVLTYYRSQHDNQSWLAATTAILDTCALLIAAVKDVNPYQAEVTFGMGRHVVVDLALVFNTPPLYPKHDRLAPDRMQRTWAALEEAGLAMRSGPAVEKKLGELRAMYEPFINGLAEFFLFAVPPMMPEAPAVDNWQTSAWMRRVVGIGKLAYEEPQRDEHFD